MCFVSTRDLLIKQIMGIFRYYDNSVEIYQRTSELRVSMVLHPVYLSRLCCPRCLVICVIESAGGMILLL